MYIIFICVYYIIYLFEIQMIKPLVSNLQLNYLQIYLKLTSNMKKK